MDENIKAVLRWVGVAVGMLLVVLITVPMALNALSESVVIGDDGPGADITEASPEEDEVAEADAVIDGTAVPVGDFSARNNEVRQADDPSVAIGGVADDAVVFAFEPIPGDVSCLDVAVLALWYEGDTGGELIATAADVTDPDPSELADGDPLPEEIPVSGAARVSETVEGAEEQWVRWDVTELYQQWVAGEILSDSDRFVLAVVPPDTDPDRRVRFASSVTDTDNTARLSWQGDETCLPGESDEDEAPAEA